ncbi:hypothetical protein [Clostridium sporogenes]|nr:hypothetical protein [Clostridium sporogenes]
MKTLVNGLSTRFRMVLEIRKMERGRPRNKSVRLRELTSLE